MIDITGGALSWRHTLMSSCNLQKDELKIGPISNFFITTEKIQHLNEDSSM